jgi:hypothetical protein
VVIGAQDLSHVQNGYLETLWLCGNGNYHCNFICFQSHV